MKAEKSSKIKRSALWDEIYKIVSQIPKMKVSGDSVDYHSASTMIEELFQSQLEKEREEDTFEFDTTMLSQTDQIHFRILISQGVKVKVVETQNQSDDGKTKQ